MVARLHRRLVILFIVVVNTANVSGAMNITQILNWNETNRAWDHRTVYEHINDIQTNVNESIKSESSPFWCPNSYDCFSRKNRLFRLCVPVSCVTVRYKDNYTEYNLPELEITAFNRTSSIMKLCAPKFSEKFLTCSKFYLEKSNYEILANGTLWNIPDGYYIPLGDFIIYANSTAVICDNVNRTLPNEKDVPPWCVPLTFTENEFQFYPSNQTVHVYNLNVTVTRAFFSLSTNLSTVNVCVALDQTLQSCDKGILPSKGYEITYNLDLHQQNRDITFKFGSYFRSFDEKHFAFCIRGTTPARRKEITILYGVANLISAIFLFLTLIVQSFSPSLNYHTKGLLCLIFSLMVMFSIISMKYFLGKFNSPTEYITAFCFHYVFIMAAFFWLNVVAYDLWKVFSTMSNAAVPGETQKKKRSFIIKCLYAWGTPVIMCGIAIAIDDSEKVQRILNIVLQLHEVGWFIEKRAEFAFFYGPVFVLLVVNTIFFILTIVNIRRSSSGTDIVNKKIHKKLFRVYVKIFLVMGLTWFLEIISWYLYHDKDQAYWYVPDFINCLQGLFLFIVYVCKKNTLKTLRSSFGFVSSSGNSSAITRSTTTSRKITK